MEVDAAAILQALPTVLALALYRLQPCSEREESCRRTQEFDRNYTTIRIFAWGNVRMKAVYLLASVFSSDSVEKTQMKSFSVGVKDRKSSWTSYKQSGAQAQHEWRMNERDERAVLFPPDTCTRFKIISGNNKILTVPVIGQIFSSNN